VLVVVAVLRRWRDMCDGTCDQCGNEYFASTIVSRGRLHWLFVINSTTVAECHRAALCMHPYTDTQVRRPGPDRVLVHAPGGRALRRLLQRRGHHRGEFLCPSLSILMFLVAVSFALVCDLMRR
jgi:hypothetical protein